MLQDIAMYVLDITNNSIRAEAKNIAIHISSSNKKNKILISVQDDGCGMSAEQLERVTNPFYTSRTTRKIGLGVSLFKELAEQCNGSFLIQSEKGKGTLIQAELEKTHWDTPPMGDLAEMLITLIQANELIEYQFDYKADQVEFLLDTKEVKQILEGVSLTEPSILLWLKEYITEGITRREDAK